MTSANWGTRLVAALLALALLVGSLLAIAEIVAAALGRALALVPYTEWTSWLRSHSWNNWIVILVLAALMILGLLLLLLAARRGKPASLALSSDTDDVSITISRRSLEKSLAAAAARTTGITGASSSVTRRRARVEARTVDRSEPGIRDSVESAVNGRLESLGLQRRLRTRIELTARGTR